jgi:hypothetical protein
MELVLAQEHWEWADLLAAANAITETQYEEASGGSGTDPLHAGYLRLPKGWVALPEELTPEMLAASDAGESTTQRIYRALRAAAPQAPLEKV